MIWSFIIIILFITALDAPKLIEEQAYNELIVFAVFLLLGIYLGMVQLYDLPFYSAMCELALLLQNR
ncbi:hypothetical protein ASZ90_017162 [hydrocarbon metagenome]|uniref:Uncharacterized protein n=1 Tax=hydrocarbon metagenome TaxID=938273 RepID=A0A0W8EAA7_9ZZZZ